MVKEAKIEIIDDDVRGRASWWFTMTASDLKESCAAWQEYHQDHENYWNKEVERLEEERRATATIKEQEITGGVNQMLSFDPALDNQYKTAVSKRDMHHVKAIEMKRWVACFSLPTSMGQLYALTPNDVEYFHLGEEPPTNDLPSARDES